MEFAACDARQTGMGSTVVDSMWRAARRLVFRSVPLGIVLLFAVANGAAASDSSECERLAQSLERLEQRSVDQPLIASARRQYERRCRAWPVDRGASIGPAGSMARPSPMGQPAAPSRAPTLPSADSAARDTHATPKASSDRVATTCALDADHPLCRSATQAPRQRSFSHWSAVNYSRCAQESSPGQPRDRDYCARSLVEQARRLGLVSGAAVERCHMQWIQNNENRSESLAIYQCLEKASHTEGMMTSRILTMTPATVGVSLPSNGYRQPEAMAAIHAGKFSQVPPLRGDGTYFHQALGQLGEMCPALGVEAIQLQMVQQLVRRQQEIMGRAARGQVTHDEAQAIVASIVVGMAMMEDCEAKEFPEERQRCERSKQDLMTLPESRDAVHDVSLLIKRHACTSNETGRFAANLGKWLLTPVATRSPLAWADGHPQQGRYRAMFENCRRQGGDGSADAWCGCYVQQFSTTRSGTRAHPIEHAATASQTAFVGDSDSWFVPSQLLACEPHLEQLKAWRRAQAPEKATACLIGQSPVPESVLPELKACRYRAAWGEIEVRNQQCHPQLLARTWGGEAVRCN